MSLLKKFIEKLYLSFDDNLVYFDSVTHCKTRFYYDYVAKSKYQKRECCIVYVDVNGLKQINDNDGHYQGTKLIKEISNSLLSLENVIDTCRIGGDEFVLICNMNFDDTEIKKLKEKISYGIVYKETYEDLSSAVKKADNEMYKMKRNTKQ